MKSIAQASTWTRKIVEFFVLVAIAASLIPTLSTKLDSYATAEPTFGPVLKAIVLILVGVGVLLIGVEMFLPGTVMKSRRKA